MFGGSGATHGDADGGEHLLAVEADCCQNRRRFVLAGVAGGTGGDEDFFVIEFEQKFEAAYVGDREADVVGEAFCGMAVETGFRDMGDDFGDKVVAKFGEAVAFSCGIGLGEFEGFG